MCIYIMYVAMCIYIYIIIHTYHFDTLDQRESVLDISHNAHISMRYKKYCKLECVI